MSYSDRILPNHPLLSADETSLNEITKTSYACPKNSRQQRALLIFVTSLAVICLGTAIFTILLLYRGFPIDTVNLNASKSTAACPDPGWRREWRSLSKVEKQNYISSVQCLMKSPSVVGLNQSLYDDFPWIHNHVGKSGTVHFSSSGYLFLHTYLKHKPESCILCYECCSTEELIANIIIAHESASFLAWHRYFIHVYEKTLQERCGYIGNLAYAIFLPTTSMAVLTHSPGTGTGSWTGKT